MSKELKPFPSGSLSVIDWCSIDATERCPYIDGPENCGIKRRLLQVPLRCIYNLCVGGLYWR